jgi:hypothetical protein
MLTHVLVHQWRKPLKAQTDNGKRDTKQPRAQRKMLCMKRVERKLVPLSSGLSTQGRFCPFPPSLLVRPDARI